MEKDSNMNLTGLYMNTYTHAYSCPYSSTQMHTNMSDTNTHVKQNNDNEFYHCPRFNSAVVIKPSDQRLGRKGFTSAFSSGIQSITVRNLRQEPKTGSEITTTDKNEEKGI